MAMPVSRLKWNEAWRFFKGMAQMIAAAQNKRGVVFFISLGVGSSGFALDKWGAGLLGQLECPL